jgi:hypothetical protein
MCNMQKYDEAMAYIVKKYYEVVGACHTTRYRYLYYFLVLVTTPVLQ